ncbi:MAG: hypothetical protein KA369_21845 [Spirochaetes bacterium]|nr:hypothetical protein [Spirochaetota bacterium]
MNRLIYFAPLASFPLMALAQQSSDESMKTDNPYISTLLILIVTLAIAVAFVAYFRLKRRGRVITAAVFSVLDWLITAPICISAGVNTYMTLVLASASALLLGFIVVRYGENLASVLRRGDARRVDADEE